VNLVLLYPQDRLEDGGFRVAGARARHLRDVLRAEVGGTFRVGLLDGPCGSARVTRMDDDAVELDVLFEPEAPPRPLVDLVLAIPRPKALTRLLPQMAAMGVDRLVLLRTWRVAKPYLTARVLLPEVHGPLLHEGLAQARATHPPRVALEPLFRPWVEDRAPALAAGATALVAHPTAERALHGVEIAPADRVVLAVGPEGGFIPLEVEASRWGRARCGSRPRASACSRRWICSAECPGIVPSLAALWEARSSERTGPLRVLHRRALPRGNEVQRGGPAP
jgi:RsmE family RNA methyltransferase